MQHDDHTTWLEAGTLLEDRWQVQGKLGRGGFATVYHGRHAKLGRQVAIKVLDIQSTPEEMKVFEKRFLREAQLAARLEHPHIVQILDYGLTTHKNLTKPFIVMEKLSGHDLEHELIHHGPLSRDRARDLFIQVLDALAMCHDQHIVHRDLKPSNLFLANPNTARERLVILDFGIARAFDDPDSKLTATSHFTGTPAYLAPEYISEQLVSPALDVYQMGLILSESLTGEPVIQASAPMAYLMAHCNGQQRIPETLLDTPVGQILALAVRVAPEDRPAHAGALKDLLTQADWTFLPARWDTAQKVSLKRTLPEASTQDGVNPWGDTAAPMSGDDVRPPAQDLATLPMTPTHTHFKLVIALIFALGILLGGGALMVIALKEPEPEVTPPQVTTTTTKPTPTALTEPPATLKIVPTEKPATVEPTKPKKAKHVVRERFELLDVQDMDRKLLHAHGVLLPMSTNVAKNDALLKHRIKEMGEQGASEKATFFSQVDDDYARATKTLQSIPSRAPSSSELDAAAKKLSSVMRNMREVARTSYAYRMTREQDLNAFTKIIAEWDIIMALYTPAHSTFLLALFTQEYTLTASRFERAPIKSSPLMHHYYGALTHLHKAMYYLERDHDFSTSGSHLKSMMTHLNAADRIDLETQPIESNQRQALRDALAASGRMLARFNDYKKLLKAHGNSTDTKAQHKLATGKAKLYMAYSHACKKHLKRP